MGLHQEESLPDEKVSFLQESLLDAHKKRAVPSLLARHPPDYLAGMEEIDLHDVLRTDTVEGHFRYTEVLGWDMVEAKGDHEKGEGYLPGDGSMVFMSHLLGLTEHIDEKTGNGQGERLETPPKVAIIVLNWNSWRDTIECFESLQQITYPNYQIILVDNGSTDDSVEKIKKWSKKELLESESLKTIIYSKEEAEAGGKPEQEKILDRVDSFKHLILILSKTNFGFAAGNNVGIRYALKRGYPYVCLLNNDTVVESDFLGQLIGTLNNYPDWMAVAPKILYKDEPTQIWYAGGRIKLWRMNAMHVGFNETDSGQWTDTRRTEHLTGCCFVARRALFEMIGLLDEAYFFGYEDLAYSCVLRERGIHVGINLKARIYHKWSGSAHKEKPFYVYYFSKNRLAVLKRHGSIIEQLSGFSFYACSRLIKFASNLLYGKTKAIRAELRAIRDFVAGSNDPP